MGTDININFDIDDENKDEDSEDAWLYDNK